MPLVNVLVNGRAFTVACDDGEEDHLRELGQFIDNRVRELSGAVGQVGDARLLLMAGLVVADELSEALGLLEDRDREIVALKAISVETEEETAKSGDRIAGALENAASRIEAIAARVAHP
jgi:cell division protein ZapA